MTPSKPLSPATDGGLASAPIAKVATKSAAFPAGIVFVDLVEDVSVD